MNVEASLLGATDAPRSVVTLVTPEGPGLAFPVPTLARRLVAFALDLLLIVALAVGVVLVGVPGARASTLMGAPLLLALFALRHGYFLWFETRRAGRTPGKRLMRLRVVDRQGGALTTGAVVARNLTREVEFFMPALALLVPGTVMGRERGLPALVSVLWLLLLAAVPLFNRWRLRVGDLLAGTLVVQVRDVALAPELDADATTAPVFSPDQLALYGVYELQVLERLLRHGRVEDATLQKVATTVQRKIGWSGPAVDARAFLGAFYLAQRERLEQDLLLGGAKPDKHAGGADDGR